MDMWSIGCVVYELFTGHILFPGKVRGGTRQRRTRAVMMNDHGGLSGSQRQPAGAAAGVCRRRLCERASRHKYLRV